MKTLITTLLILTLSSFLMAQMDSTITESTEPTEVEESVVESTDSLKISAEEIAATDSTTLDSVLSGTMEMDSTMTDSSDLVEADTLEVVEPEMVEVQNDPKPVVVTGLSNLGPLYFWSTDGLLGLNLESLDYLTILDPVLIAVKAADCNDIVCHLLATDSSDVDYVIVTPEDSTDFRVYDTDTKVVVLEAPGSDLTIALDIFLRDLAGTTMVEVVPEDTAFVGPVLTDDAELHAARHARHMHSLKIKNRQFRSMDELFSNPANLGREFNSFTSWNLLPDFKISFRNSLLTPGWYTEWWTTGVDLGDASGLKGEYLATIMDKDLAINVTPDFHTLLGFRIGRFGFNISGKSHIKMVIPGNTLALPMQDILLNEPIENSGLEIEAIPFVGKASFSYAHPVNTPFGDLKVGLGVNMYEAVGYLRTVSDDFSVLLTQDSIMITASGEGWVTQGGVEGHADDPDFDEFDVGSTASDLSVGIDLGVIMDLHDYLKQEVEVQFALRNIGAQYKWSDLTHEAWTFEQLMPAAGNIETDTADGGGGIEQYQTSTTTVLGEGEAFSIDVPTVMNLSAVYQPIPKVIIGAGIQKAFTDEVRLGYGPDLEINYQLNLYPASWLDFSYYKQNQYGEPVHTFGSGFHFGFLDTGFTLSLFNGLNTDAKGLGFGLRSSLHF